MRTLALLLTILLAAAACSTEPSELGRYESTERHMGVLFTIVVYAKDEESANAATGAAFSRVAELNRIMSDYDPESELSRLSKQSPTASPVKVSNELWTVLASSQRLSEKSDGAFDVTVGPMSRLWRRARRQRELPRESRISEAKQSVGYRFMQLDETAQSVKLMRPDMRLDLGGIAKGFAADEALRTLRERGIRRALVDASGDLALGDPPPDKKGWRIGIAPLEPDAPPSEYLLLTNCGVATSGDAWQHVEIDGTRYSHIVDPRTGLGLTNQSSVTVVAPTGMLADGYASAISVLGPKSGIELAESSEGIEALVVQAGDGRPEVHRSGGFQSMSFD